MDFIAQLLWNPFLSLWYVVVGAFLAIVTGGVALRRALPVFARTWTSSSRGAGDRQIPHRHAFFSALAASVGVGNLAGVATAIHLGGPGALFWMWVSALLGMSFRMSSTYLAIRHRPARQSSLLFATPMTYLKKFLTGRLRILPAVLAGLIAVKGLVTANLIQANSVAHGLCNGFDISHLAVASALAIAVALVILGGLKSIVRISSAVAPWMLFVYVGLGLLVMFEDPARSLQSLADVFLFAFRPYSVLGGAAGYTVFQTLQFGVARGVFSHGSGIGVAPFLQASNTDHPARGAYMAAVVPVFDTLIVCTVTGMVILSTGAWRTSTSAHLTVAAFEAAFGSAGKYLVAACLVTFAFTTIINWSYFSERCFQYLGGTNIVAYRCFFAAVTFIGPFFPVALVWSLGDVLIGLLLLVHLLPLIYAVLKSKPTMMEDLSSLDG